ncbi:MAG TPA: DUF1800 domain-containing protein [Thermoanaerobaculia bacterium]|nr:DUF1800 domain-containing protein [Thermoanaerobaculia bacterium]
MKRLIPIAALLLIAAQPQPIERQRAEHALNRLAFGARPGDVERVMRIGVDRWIEQQLHPERIADRTFPAIRSPELPSPGGRTSRPPREGGRDVRLPLSDEAKKALRKEARRGIEELSAQRILRAAESERQLNEVMVDFWMNHFNVFAGKGLDRFLIGSYERDTIRPRIWGRFEELLMATAKSPAMLWYLDNARSRRDAINENYAREIMELHTLGVDGGYTQKDVTELARVFTGWTIDRRDAGFTFRRFLHDSESKLVLGQRFRAAGGIEEGEAMVRFLARHPSTAKHIATKLCQRLVADEPPAALVDRVAKQFLATNGDLRATVKAVIESPEFSDPRYYRTKVKSPFEYAISAVRAAGARIEDPLPLARELRKIGEPLYFAQPPTGYSDASKAWSSDGALVARLNFAVAVATNRMPGIRVSSTDSDALARMIGAPEFQKQ